MEGQDEGVSNETDTLILGFSFLRRPNDYILVVVSQREREFRATNMYNTRT